MKPRWRPLYHERVLKIQIEFLWYFSERKEVYQRLSARHDKSSKESKLLLPTTPKTWSGWDASASNLDHKTERNSKYRLVFEC